jgi:hypothetical protein
MSPQIRDHDVIDDTLNIFDSLPTLARPQIISHELDKYLSTDVEQVSDVLAWWHEHRAMYPHLSRMALDYLTIPGEFCYIMTVQCY